MCSPLSVMVGRRRPLGERPINHTDHAALIKRASQQYVAVATRQSLKLSEAAGERLVDSGARALSASTRCLQQECAPGEVVPGLSLGGSSMTEGQAIEFVDVVRRAGAELIQGLRDLEQGKPDDVRHWELEVAMVMGEMQNRLLEPVFAAHPNARPKELGGLHSRHFDRAKE
jgi:hypothetical protein